MEVKLKKRAGLAKNLLSLWLLFAALLAPFHHHDDHLAHSDCPLCHFQKQLDSADSQVAPLPQTCDFLVSSPQTFLPQLHSQVQILGFFSRAPPIS